MSQENPTASQTTAPGEGADRVSPRRKSLAVDALLIIVLILTPIIGWLVAFSVVIVMSTADMLAKITDHTNGLELALLGYAPVAVACALITANIHLHAHHRRTGGGPLTNQVMNDITQGVMRATTWSAFGAACGALARDSDPTWVTMARDYTNNTLTGGIAWSLGLAALLVPLGALAFGATLIERGVREAPSHGDLADTHGNPITSVHPVTPQIAVIAAAVIQVLSLVALVVMAAKVWS